ncbi:hypothetical protein PF010_g29058 [Phytophthora fragariae]|uniref:Uncharacterized protein n=1 Tax=Phytophthora fragariae TaxID=53985 RepID=A0A6G0JPB8_9STRA|nr:hypothetical protein PF010_g29058 [Phytophthora fragariae]
MPVAPSPASLVVPPPLPEFLPTPPTVPTTSPTTAFYVQASSATDPNADLTTGCTVEFASSEDEDDSKAPCLKEKTLFVDRVEFATTEAARLGIDGYDGYLYSFAYNYGKRGDKMDGRSVYRCISHDTCENRIRLSPSREEDVQTCWLQDAGAHTGAATDAKKRGIPGFLLREVDDILLGCGPKKCRKILLDRYIDVPSRYGSVPDETQLKNRKSTLMKQRAGGWEIKNVAGLLEWTSMHLCTTKGEFFLRGSSSASDAPFDWQRDFAVLDAMDKDLKHGTLVLECFSHEVTLDDGKKADCCGLILTSRAIFWNVLKAYNGQNNDGVLGVTDGTYRLHFGGWTLVDFGTYTTHYEKKRYSKTFVPWAYMFVRTEHHVAYATMFKVCGAADKRRLLAENDFYEASVAVSIKHLTKARTERQFSDLARLFLAYWREHGETEYASWFEETYLGSTWMFWYYQAAIPGVTPSQNALESHHKVIKITCVASLRSSTAVVLNDGIPSILFHEASQPLRQDLFHFCEGPLCSEAVANAQRLLENKKNYYQLKARRSRVLFGVLFNATKFIISSTNINGASMDRSRAQRYLDSLSGKLPQDISVRNRLKRSRLFGARDQCESTAQCTANEKSKWWSKEGKKLSC